MLYRGRLAGMAWLMIVLVACPLSVHGQTPADTSSSPSHVRFVRPTPVGGVRIISRHNNRPRLVIRLQPMDSPTEAAAPASPVITQSGVSQAELDSLEARLVRRLTRALQVTVASPSPTIITVPGPTVYRESVQPQPAPPVATEARPSVPIVTAPPPPPDTVYVERPRLPQAVPVRPGVPTVEEVERALLDTGIFRSLSVYFEIDQSRLLPSSSPTLDTVADVLARYPGLRIQVAGHTDATGSDEYNQRLSESRAASVVDYLARRGIESSRLSAIGYGETRPIASNATATERTLNRRVEFVVVNPEAAVRESRRVREAD